MLNQPLAVYRGTRHLSFEGDSSPDERKDFVDFIFDNEDDMNGFYNMCMIRLRENIPFNDLHAMTYDDYKSLYLTPELEELVCSIL